MPNYTTLLKTWGDTGGEYPTGYSYIEDEQPVDVWDNFLIYNVVKDIQSLIDTTNNDLLAQNGDILKGNLDFGGNNALNVGQITASNGTVIWDGSSINSSSIETSDFDSRYARLFDGVQLPTFTTTGNVPVMTKGEVVFVDGDGLYIEDGN